MLHQDVCSADVLICEQCGERFAARRATRDGWHYQCPSSDCGGSGLGNDLHAIRDFRMHTQITQ